MFSWTRNFGRKSYRFCYCWGRNIIPVVKSLEFLGCLLIANGIGVVAWWLFTGKPNAGYAIVLCLIIIFVGLVFVFNARLSEITIKNVGSMKTAARQATDDA